MRIINSDDLLLVHYVLCLRKWGYVRVYYRLLLVICYYFHGAHLSSQPYIGFFFQSRIRHSRPRQSRIYVALFWLHFQQSPMVGV